MGIKWAHIRVHVDGIPDIEHILSVLLWPLFIQESHRNTRPVPPPAGGWAAAVLSDSHCTQFQNASEGRAGEFQKQSLPALLCVSSGLFFQFAAECPWAVITSSAKTKTAAHVAVLEWFPFWSERVKIFSLYLSTPNLSEGWPGSPFPAKKVNHWRVFTQIIWTNSHCDRSSWSFSTGLYLSHCLQLEKNYGAKAETQSWRVEWTLWNRAGLPFSSAHTRHTRLRFLFIRGRPFCFALQLRHLNPPPIHITLSECVTQRWAF